MTKNTYEYQKSQNIKYRDLDEIRAKWIRIIRNINKYTDAQTMLYNIREAFTLVECVMYGILQEYRSAYLSLGQLVPGERNTYVFHYPTGDVTINFSDKSAYGMSATLRTLGYALPDELDDTRKLRNFVSHNLETTTVDYFKENMNYDNVMKAIQYLGQSLVVMNKLTQEDIIPSFDSLRVKEGELIGLSHEFTVERFISKSGTSRLYEGRHTRLNVRVAIKELFPKPYNEQMLMQERDLLVSLQHPQIPRIYDVFNQNGTFYIVMDYIDGVGLDRFLEQNVISMAEKLRILTEICEVVNYLHDKKQLVHTDLKPQNVMIDEAGVVHIIDFGTAMQKNELLEIRSFSKGFTAPEVAEQKPIDYRIDIYSIGGIIKYMFQAEINNQQHAYSETIANIERIVERCMQHNPYARYNNVVEIKYELMQIVNAGTESIRVIPKQKKQSRINVPRAIFYVVCILTIVFSTGLKLASYLKNNKKQSEDRNTSVQTSQIDSVVVSDKEAMGAFKELEQKAWEALITGNEQAYIDLFRCDSTTEAKLRENFRVYHADLTDIYTDIDYILLCNENGICFGSTTRTLVSGEGENVSFVRREFTYPFSYKDGEWKFDVTAQTGAITESKYREKVYNALSQTFNDARTSGRNYALLCSNNFIWLDSTLVYEGMLEGSAVAVAQAMDGSIEFTISVKNGTKSEQLIRACTVNLKTAQGHDIVTNYRAELSATVQPYTSMLLTFTVSKDAVQNVSAVWDAMDVSVEIE